MSKPRLLDLFCCEGGAARGYADAGFEVVGVDIEPQPNYPFEFVNADVLALSRDALRGCWHESSSKTVLPGMLHRCLGHFDAVHASPPCQAHSDLQKQSKCHYEDFIEPTRALLEAWGLPYVIENVEGAPLRDPVVLCGTMFPELRVIRHRLFETNWQLEQPAHPAGRHPLVFTHDKRKAHYGQLDQDTSYVQVTGGGNCTIANKRAAMGTPWMSGHGCNEAIPPAYAEHLGRQAMALLQMEKAA
jgi:DNA (cytosine-5)-methyltransferase 1